MRDTDVVVDNLYSIQYLLGDKWSPAIFLALADGPMRRADLLATIRSYSAPTGWSERQHTLHDSILTRCVKKMVAHGLLHRDEDRTFPPKVTYSLTPAAAEVFTAIRPLVEWVRRHPGLVERARAHSRSDVDEPLIEGTQ